MQNSKTKNNSDLPNMLKSREVAEYLGVSIMTISRMIKRDELTPIYLTKKFTLIANDNKLVAAKNKAAANGFKSYRKSANKN